MENFILFIMLNGAITEIVPHQYTFEQCHAEGKIQVEFRKGESDKDYRYKCVIQRPLEWQKERRMAQWRGVE